VNRAEISRVEMAVVALIVIMSGAEAERSAIATADSENVRITPRTIWALLALLLSFSAYHTSV